MRNKKLLYIIFAFTIIFMFASIFVTVALTGGRDIRDFTDTDKKIFSAFITLEIIDVIACFALAIRIGKISRAPIEQKKPSAYDKEMTVRQLILSAISLTLSIVFSVIGGAAVKPSLTIDTAAQIFLCIVGVLAVLGLLSHFLSNLYINRFNNKSNSEKVSFLYSHREDADRSASRLLKKLRVLYSLTNIYAVFIFILGLALALFSAALDLWPAFVFISSLVIYSAISRIPLPTPRALFTEENGYVKEDEFPELYSVVNEAKDTLGVKGEIRIVLLAECTAGIRRFGNIISIQVGAILLGSMSREELKNIFLHEFAHLGEDGTPASRMNNHMWWLEERANRRVPINKLIGIFFRFPNNLFALNHTLYTYASTIGVEEKADRAMKVYGDPRYAGSSLLKLQYYELYCWEKGSYDTPAILESEELKADLVKNELASFKEQMAKRRDFWNRMIDVEIISRGATHPTIKMRLDAIGHTDYTVNESTDSDGYKKEQIKAVELLDSKIYDNRKDHYAEEREADYLEPKRTVEEWEAGGREISHDEYREVIFSLRSLGRVTEASELCDRVIDELPDSANHYAHFIKGCTMLHSFDEGGIEHIYHAIENNHNYIEEGMEAIGQFCCLCGRQDDLDTYRRRVIELFDERERTFSALDNLGPKDNLISENLPEQIHSDLISLVDSMSDRIDEVYLVRKVVSDDFFGSVVILKLKDGADEKASRDVFNRIFLFLDSLDWQFTLFDYRNSPMNVIKKIPNSLIYGAKTSEDD